MTKFYTDSKKRVRPITRGRSVGTLSKGTTHLSVPKDERYKSILKHMKQFFPHYAPVIEVVELVLNNRDFLESIVKILVSNKSEDEKLEIIERKLFEIIKEKTVIMLPMENSEDIEELLKEWNVDKKTKSEANIYFEKALKTLIKESVDVKPHNDSNIMNDRIKRFQKLIVKKNILDFILRNWHAIGKQILINKIDNNQIAKNLDEILLVQANKKLYEQQFREIVKQVILGC